MANPHDPLQPSSIPVLKPLNALLAKYAVTAPQEDPDPTGPGIIPELVPQVNTWLKGHVPVSEIKKLQEKAERPISVPQAKPIKINPELYYAIAKEGIELDKPLGFIN